MSTTTSPIFTGSSQFSQDFAGSITRAVQIASLPITQMKGDVTALQSQSDSLTGNNNATNPIGPAFAALKSSIDGISQAMSGSTFTTEVSNPAAVSASVADGAMEGVYSIDVQSVGVYATSNSTDAWVSPTDGQTHTYQLVIDSGSGSSTISVTPADGSATSLAQAINLAAGDKVQATVINVGTNASKISLKSNTLGPATLDILNGGTSLQTQGPDGQLATYSVDGNATVTTDSRTVTLAQGLTVTMLAADADPNTPTPVNITVSRSTSALSDALKAFTTAYNSAVDTLDAQSGQTAGALSGQTIVSDLRQTLRGIVTYASPGVGGLTTPVDPNATTPQPTLLGLDLGTDGHLTFDSGAMMSSDILNSTTITAFLGSATGDGFLRTATDALNSVADPTTGLIETTAVNFQNQIASINSNIADKQTQVDQLQQNLQDQMAAADAAISAMEQQYSYLSSMFSAMQTADSQYK